MLRSVRLVRRRELGACKDGVGTVADKTYVGAEDRTPYANGIVLVDVNVVVFMGNV